MITPPTKSFYAIHITGEAADIVTNQLSPETMSDIQEAILLSDDFTEDIEATNEMDSTLQKLQANLDPNVEVVTIHNPLYVRSTQEQIDEVLEGDPTSDSFKFTGMHGNPFAMKRVDITLNGREMIQACVACHQFNLPSYNEIIDAQAGSLN